MSEQLTEDERDSLDGWSTTTEKALRIIDAQAAALERVRAYVRSSGGSCQGDVILTLASTEPKVPREAR